MNSHCRRGHFYNEINTYIRPDGGRDCRACQALRRRKGGGRLTTHCKRGHEITEANSYYKLNGTRQCRACAIARARRRKVVAPQPVSALSPTI